MNASEVCYEVCYQRLSFDLDCSFIAFAQPFDDFYFSTYRSRIHTHTAIMRGKHVLKGMKPHDKNFSTQDAINNAYHWLINDFAVHNCRLPSGTNQKVTNCRCTRFLSEADNTEMAMSLAEYLIHYAKMKEETKSNKLA